MLARIVQMVADAQRSRAPIQRLADQVAGWFVPAVLLIALIAFGVWGIWGPEPRLAHGLIAAVAVASLVEVVDQLDMAVAARQGSARVPQSGYGHEIGRAHV